MWDVDEKEHRALIVQKQGFEYLKIPYTISPSFHVFLQNSIMKIFTIDCIVTVEVLPAQAMVVTGSHMWALPPGGMTPVFSQMCSNT